MVLHVAYVYITYALVNDKLCIKFDIKAHILRYIIFAVMRFHDTY